MGFSLAADLSSDGTTREGDQPDGCQGRPLLPTRDRMLRGVEILNNPVKVTLGPKGRNVVLDKSFGAPRVTKGVVTGIGAKSQRSGWREQGMAPDEWVTDKNPAYRAALRTLKLTRAPHTRRKRANNRAESSHVPVRRRERKLQGFKTPRSAQRSCPCTRPPTTSLPFLVISSLLALTASFEPRRLRRGATRPVSPPDTSS